MPLPFVRFSLVVLLAGALLGGCASKKPAPEPKPQTIHLRSDASVNATATGTPGKIIQKPLFNIVVNPRGITVNGAKVKNLAELERLLAKHQQPALTIAAHKCLSSEKAADIMNLAQRYTDTPIAYGSYGTLDDPECSEAAK